MKEEEGNYVTLGKMMAEFDVFKRESKLITSNIIIFIIKFIINFL
jgi:hypothetical protein